MPLEEYAALPFVQSRTLLNKVGAAVVALCMTMSNASNDKKTSMVISHVVMVVTVTLFVLLLNTRCYSAFRRRRKKIRLPQLTQCCVAYAEGRYAGWAPEVLDYGPDSTRVDLFASGLPANLKNP